MPSPSPSPSPAPIFNNPVQGGYGATYTYPYIGPAGFRASIYDRQGQPPRPSPTPAAPSSFQSRYFRYLDSPNQSFPGIDVPPAPFDFSEIWRPNYIPGNQGSSGPIVETPNDRSMAGFDWRNSDLSGLTTPERNALLRETGGGYPSPGGYMGQGYVPGYPAGTNMRNPGRDANGNPINPNGLYSLGRTQSEIDSIMRQNTNNVILGGVGSMAGIGQAAPGSQAAQFAANQRGVQLNNDMYGGRAINFGQPDELTMGPNRQMAYDPARDAQTARTTAEWRSGSGNRWRSNYGGLMGLAGSRGQPGGR